MISFGNMMMLPPLSPRITRIIAKIHSKLFPNPKLCDVGVDGCTPKSCRGDQLGIVRGGLPLKCLANHQHPVRQPAQRKVCSDVLLLV